MSDPLSIAAGVVGILTAAQQISSALIKFTRSLRDATYHVGVTLREVNEISSILSQLQAFVLDEAFARRQVANVLKLDQIISVIGGCVLTFSELEKLLDEIKTEDMSIIDRLKWRQKQSAIAELTQRLQNHKTSLSLILNIGNATSLQEANNSLDNLHSIIETHYQEIVFRLQFLEHRELEGPLGDPQADVETQSITKLRIRGPTSGSMPEDSELENFEFSADLQNSRVYKRTKGAWRNSAFSVSVNSTFTGNWSSLSGLSLADVSVVSVINLPITLDELFNSRRLTQTWSHSSLAVGPNSPVGLLVQSPKELVATIRTGDGGSTSISNRTPARVNEFSQSSRPAPSNSVALYPWSQRKLSFTSSQGSPFPRFGTRANNVATKRGEVYLMGGLVGGRTVKGDIWMMEVDSAFDCYPIETTWQGPGPRVGHAALMIGNAFIVWGGDTKEEEEDDQSDDTLYLLNICKFRAPTTIYDILTETATRHCSRALPPGYRPLGRYGHTLTLLGSKIFVFGGQLESRFFDDLSALDLNRLQDPTSHWEILHQNKYERGPGQGQTPPARTNHTAVTWNEKLYIFGGTDGVTWFNDLWSYEPRYNTWSLIDCIGYIPAPREGHSAAIVDDVMYVFGGRLENGDDLGDLAALDLLHRRWYTFQNMGRSPSPRSGQSMTVYRKQIFVFAGEPSSLPYGDPTELSLLYVLDTTKIRYPGGKRRPAPEPSAT